MNFNQELPNRQGVLGCDEGFHNRRKRLEFPAFNVNLQDVDMGVTWAFKYLVERTYRACVHLLTYRSIS